MVQIVLTVTIKLGIQAFLLQMKLTANETSLYPHILKASTLPPSLNNKTMNRPRTSPKRIATKRMRRRKVTFSEKVVTNMKRVTQHDRVKAWYSKQELEAMRKHVKVQSKIYRAAMNKSSPEASLMSSLVLPFQGCTVEKKMKLLTMSCASTASSTPHSTFRGLESHIFLEKQRNRIIAMKTTLEYQRRAQELLKVAESQNHPDINRMKACFSDRLAIVCNQLSNWSTYEALAIANFDASGVYESPPKNLCSLLAGEEKVINCNVSEKKILTLKQQNVSTSMIFDREKNIFGATHGSIRVHRNNLGEPKQVF